MRDGWSLKSAARVLGIHERRVTQALDPALEKIARLWLADATLTMTAILAKVEELKQIRDDELEELIRRKNGTADRRQPDVLESR